MAQSGDVSELTAIYASGCGCGRAVLLLERDIFPECSLCGAPVSWTMVWTMLPQHEGEDEVTEKARPRMWHVSLSALRRNALRTVRRALSGRSSAPAE